MPSSQVAPGIRARPAPPTRLPGSASPPPTPAPAQPASLTAALPLRVAAAAGEGVLRRALVRGGSGGHTVGRALLSPVQVTTPRDVWGSRNPGAQVRPGAEGPCREGAAESRLVSGATPVAQAIESVRAPRMHRGRGRTRPAHPSPPPLGPRLPRAAPPPTLRRRCAWGNLTTGSHGGNPEVLTAHDRGHFRPPFYRGC
jgi:hypothetical protein